MTLNILIAPSGFKESLSVLDVTEAIADGVRAVLPDARILKAPLVDGGEGFTEALVQATGGALHPVTVTGAGWRTGCGAFRFPRQRTGAHRRIGNGRRRRFASGTARPARSLSDHQPGRGRTDFGRSGCQR